MLGSETSIEIVHASLTAIILLGCAASYTFRLNCNSETGATKSIIKTLLSSVLAALLVFLASEAFIDNLNLRLALTGFASFSGYDLLTLCNKDLLKTLIDKLLGRLK